MDIEKMIMEAEKKFKKCPFSNQQCTEYCKLYVEDCALLEIFRTTNEILYELNKET